jgi:signal transduction histidine kinase
MEVIWLLFAVVIVGTACAAVHFMLKKMREETQRMKQVEERRKEFLQMIAHDVRTPLTSLQTVMAMLTKGSYGELNDRGKERVSQAEQSLAYIIGLLSQLSEVEKLSCDEELSLDYGTCSIKSTCEKTFEIVKPFADLKQIHLVLESDDVDVEADHGRVSQVIVNLVSNAIKHAPDESTIRISTEKSPDSIHVRISDQGPGLERELRTQAFERFTQFGTPDDGMGLGLAISKAIIEAHEGDIGFESQFGRGCCIWFRLPLTKPAHSTPRAAIANQ